MVINMKARISPMKLLRWHNRVFALRSPSQCAWTLAFSENKRGKDPLISLRMERTRVPLFTILLPLAMLLAVTAMMMPREK